MHKFVVMALTRVDINSNLIEWAISRAGYELNEYLLQNPSVEEWVNEVKKPTIRQLENFAKKVHVPFGYLFLPEPPEEELSFPFFRTGKGAVRNVSLNVYDTVQIVQKRQDWLSEYLREQGHEPIDFVGKFNVHTPYREIVNDIRNTLQLQINWASYHNTFERALDFLAIQIEERGVIINFSGIVGNLSLIHIVRCRR